MSSKSKHKSRKPSLVPGKKETETPPPSRRKKLDAHWIALGVIALVLCFIRIRLASVPLERDEGEYAYIGKLILEGIAPYKEAYNMKLPGTYTMYAFIMLILGKSIAGIHYGLLLVNLGTMLFLFSAIRRFFNPSVALFTAASYGIMAVTQSVFGFAAHATHFVVFFAAGALYFLLLFYETRKLSHAFLTGLFFGLSFLMKQQAVFFLVFGGIMIILYALPKKPVRYLSLLKQLSLYSAGVFLPYLITLLILGMAGALDKFWFWTVEYASKYAAGATFSQGVDLFKRSFSPMWKEFGFLWVLFLAGLVLTFLSRYPLEKKLTALLFSLFAFLTICPGFYFREHYFVSFLPAVALLAGLAVDQIAGFLSRVMKTNALPALTYVLLFLVFFSVIAGNSDYFLKTEPNEISRQVYGRNPFIEAVEIADYIKQNSEKTDRIAVLGSEPEILFYADRQSATGYIYMYGLMELHSYNKKMQEEMIAEVEKNKPKYLIFCKMGTSWLFQKGSPTRIFEWLDTYLKNQFVFEGVADIASDYQTIYKWGEEARSYNTTNENIVLVYKRKP